MADLTNDSIAVIGAGIVGVQTARALQRQGRQVTLIDKAEPGMATSFGNAGFIATDEIFPLAHGRVLRSLPRMLLEPLSPLAMRWREFPRLAPWFFNYARACSHSRSELAIEALASLQGLAGQAWRDVAEREGLKELVRNNGALKLFESDAGFASTREEREVQHGYDIRWEVLSRDALTDIVPEAGTRIRHAVYYPDGMHVTNPHTVTNTLFQKFRADGGEFEQWEVNGFKQDGARITGVRGEPGPRAFAHTVICTGHLSGRLLEALGYRVPIVAERGYHVEMSHGEIGFDLPIGFHERGFYATPMSSGLRLAGTTEFSSAKRDAPPTWERAALLARHVEDVLPGVAIEQTGRWMGHRPTLYDFLPVIGHAPDRDGLSFAFGHHHLGLTLSAITADIIVGLLRDDNPRIDITPYSLARFA